MNEKKFSRLVMVMSIITLGITISCQNPLESNKTQGSTQESSRSTTAWRTGIYIPKKGDPISVKATHLMTTPTMYSTSKVCYGAFGGAADGDFDMAYALLIADKQWGSSGKHNYKQIATDLIKALKKYYVASAENSGHILLATHLQAGNTPDYKRRILLGN